MFPYRHVHTSTCIFFLVDVTYLEREEEEQEKYGYSLTFNEKTLFAIANVVTSKESGYERMSPLSKSTRRVELYCRSSQYVTSIMMCIGCVMLFNRYWMR